MECICEGSGYQFTDIGKCLPLYAALGFHYRYYHVPLQSTFDPPCNHPHLLQTIVDKDPASILMLTTAQLSSLDAAWQQKAFSRLEKLHFEVVGIDACLRFHYRFADLLNPDLSEKLRKFVGDINISRYKVIADKRLPIVINGGWDNALWWTEEAETLPLPLYDFWPPLATALVREPSSWVSE